MRRRDFVTLIGGSAAAAWPLAARAQPAKIPRIGYLGYFSPALEKNNVEAFRQGLRDLGYVEGQNIVIEYRSVEGTLNRLPEIAAELVRLNVDVIVTLATPGALAVKQASSTIPIVVPAMADPVRDSLVVSLARPGGNITGLTFLGPELVPKRLGLLKEIVPAASRVAVLWHPGVYSESTMSNMLKGAEDAAQSLGLRLQLLGAESPGDFDGAFAAIQREHADALLVFPSPMLYLNYRRIVDLAANYRLPAVYPWREAVDAGGFIAYGANISDMVRHSAVLVDKILKGAKPAELPVEQPTKFELVINKKTAKALGLTVPLTLQASADEVIE